MSAGLESLCNNAKLIGDSCLIAHIYLNVDLARKEEAGLIGD